MENVSYFFKNVFFFFGEIENGVSGGQFVSQYILLAVINVVKV